MKKYSVIYADPPWHTTAGPKRGKYKVVEGKQIHHTVDNKSRPLPYSTMSLEDICRDKTAGWDVFGNEVNDSITLPCITE